MDDWEYSEFQCPKCKAYPTRFVHCPQIGCDDGAQSARAWVSSIGAVNVAMN